MTGTASRPYLCRRNIENEHQRQIIGRAFDLITGNAYRRQFIERLPFDLLERTVHAAESSKTAQEVISQFVAEARLPMYFHPVTSGTHATALSESRGQVEYLLEMLPFVLRLIRTNSPDDDWYYPLQMIRESGERLDKVQPVSRRVAIGKGHCLLVWVHQRYFPIASPDEDLCRRDLGFITEHIEEIEQRLEIIVERGVTSPENLSLLLEHHSSLSGGVL